MNGRHALVGQQKPAYLSDLALAMERANTVARQSAGEFENNMTEATLAQLMEDDRAAQDAEQAYLEALADSHDVQVWAAENAQEQVSEHFTEVEQ
jgi:hypothetical protein